MCACCFGKHTKLVQPYRRHLNMVAFIPNHMSLQYNSWKWKALWTCVSCYGKHTLTLPNPAAQEQQDHVELLNSCSILLYQPRGDFEILISVLIVSPWKPARQHRWQGETVLQGWHFLVLRNWSCSLLPYLQPVYSEASGGHSAQVWAPLPPLCCYCLNCTSTHKT